VLLSIARPHRMSSGVRKRARESEREREREHEREQGRERESRRQREREKERARKRICEGERAGGSEGESTCAHACERVRVCVHTEQIELPAKRLDEFLWSFKSNINQSSKRAL